MGVFSIAPMMGYTDKHFRVLARYAAPSVLLYTQMIVADALLRNINVKRAFGIDASLENVVLQLGGSNIDSLVYSAVMAEQFGYGAVNLNVGCPSNKVKLAGIGACLFKSPALVAKCVAAIKQKVKIPVTVKARIGVDDVDSFEHLIYFVKALKESGCDGVIIHARKAWLNGLSPKKNRTVPPLNYEMVVLLKKELAGYYVGVNGGIDDFASASQFVGVFDEVMLGRRGYKSLQLMARLNYQRDSYVCMAAVLERYLAYMDNVSDPSHHVLKHCMSLYYNGYKASCWRKAVALAMVDCCDNNLNSLLKLSKQIDEYNVELLVN